MLSPLQTAKVLSVVSRHDTLARRFLSVSSTRHSRPDVEPARMARMMKKIMTGTKHFTRKPDSHYHPSKHLTEFGFMQKGKGVSGHKPVSGKLMRRVDMLNNLFVENITSLLATGEVSPEFHGLGVQISKVKVTSDFSAVNVYWYATGTEKDEVIEQLLSKSSGHLRHELSQLRVIGIVPPINFYRDRTFSKLQEVESLLSKLSVDPQTTEPTPNDNVDTLLGQISEKKSENQVSRSEENEDILCSKPEVDSMSMTHDILSVKHDRIMDGIKKSLQKQFDKKKARQQSLQVSAITSENSEFGDPSSTRTVGPLEEEVVNHQKRQREFLKYLKQQQAEKSKELRRMSTEAKEQEFYRSMKEERQRNQLLNQLDEMDFGDSDIEDDEKYNEEEEVYYSNLREQFK